MSKTTISADIGGFVILFLLGLAPLQAKADLNNESILFLNTTPKTDMEVCPKRGEKVRVRIKALADTLQSTIQVCRISEYKKYGTEYMEPMGILIASATVLDTVLILESGSFYLFRTDQEHEISPREAVINCVDLLIEENGEWCCKAPRKISIRYLPIVSRSGEIVFEECCSDFKERIISITFETLESFKTITAEVKEGKYKMEGLRGSESYKIEFLVVDDFDYKLRACLGMPPIKLNRQKKATLDLEPDFGKGKICAQLAVYPPSETILEKAHLIRRPRKGEVISWKNYEMFFVPVGEISRACPGSFVLEAITADEQGVYAKDLCLPTLANPPGSNVKEILFEVELEREDLLTESLAELIRETVQRKIGQDFSCDIYKREKRDSAKVSVKVGGQIYNLGFYINQDKKGCSFGWSVNKIKKLALEFSYEEIKGKIRAMEEELKASGELGKVTTYLIEKEVFIDTYLLKMEISYCHFDSRRDRPAGWKGEIPSGKFIATVYKRGSNINSEDFKEMVRKVKE